MFVKVLLKIFKNTWKCLIVVLPNLVIVPSYHLLPQVSHYTGCFKIGEFRIQSMVGDPVELVNT
jgi:hypothetical protein